MSESSSPSLQREDLSCATALLRGVLESEADVKKVWALEALPEPGRWLYLIETPFMTFPKFAVGTTNQANSAVQILMTCGSVWAATDAFNLALASGGHLGLNADSGR